MEAEILTKIKPCGQRVIIKKFEGNRITKSNIEVIETPNYFTGTIIDVSDHSEINLKVGSKVYYEPGAAFPIGNEGLFLIAEQNIVAVIID